MQGDLEDLHMEEGSEDGGDMEPFVDDAMTCFTGHTGLWNKILLGERQISVWGKYLS